MAKKTQNDEESVFQYYKLELVPDPAYTEETSTLTTDTVTWQTFIVTALKTLHGVFGQSIDPEILQTSGKSALVRIQKEDMAKFESALVMYSPTLGMFGLDEVGARIEMSDTTKYTDL